MDFESEHLGLDQFDRVYLVVDGERVRNLGHIDSDPEWPREMGQEPPWFMTEVAWLLDQWEDARRFALGCRAAAEAAYQTAIGA